MKYRRAINQRPRYVMVEDQRKEDLGPQERRKSKSIVKKESNDDKEHK